jgi:hypothetical protein
MKRRSVRSARAVARAIEKPSSVPTMPVSTARNTLVPSAAAILTALFDKAVGPMSMDEGNSCG